MENNSYNSAATTKVKGNFAENLATQFLENKGYTILKRNFIFGKVGEIDIIARQGKALVFVEVKARSNSEYGNVLESITPAKQKKIRKVAEGYYYINKLLDIECRFDVITIDLFRNPPCIEHLENAM